MNSADLLHAADLVDQTIRAIVEDGILDRLVSPVTPAVPQRPAGIGDAAVARRERMSLSTLVRRLDMLRAGLSPAQLEAIATLGGASLVLPGPGGWPDFLSRRRNDHKGVEQVKNLHRSAKALLPRLALIKVAGTIPIGEAPDENQITLSITFAGEAGINSLAALETKSAEWLKMTRLMARVLAVQPDTTLIGIRRGSLIIEISAATALAAGLATAFKLALQTAQEWLKLRKMQLELRAMAVATPKAASDALEQAGLATRQQAPERIGSELKHSLPITDNTTDNESLNGLHVVAKTMFAFAAEGGSVTIAMPRESEVLLANEIVQLQGETKLLQTEIAQLTGRLNPQRSIEEGSGDSVGERTAEPARERQGAKRSPRRPKPRKEPKGKQRTDESPEGADYGAKGEPPDLTQTDTDPGFQASLPTVVGTPPGGRRSSRRKPLNYGGIVPWLTGLITAQPAGEPGSDPCGKEITPRRRSCVNPKSTQFRSVIIPRRVRTTAMKWNLTLAAGVPSGFQL